MHKGGLEGSERGRGHVWLGSSSAMGEESFHAVPRGLQQRTNFRHQEFYGVIYLPPWDSLTGPAASTSGA